MTDDVACEFDIFNLSSEIECLAEFDDQILKKNVTDLRKCAKDLNKILERING